jgi:hypothetical protein
MRKFTISLAHPIIIGKKIYIYEDIHIPKIYTSMNMYMTVSCEYIHDKHTQHSRTVYTHTHTPLCCKPAGIKTHIHTHIHSVSHPCTLHTHTHTHTHIHAHTHTHIHTSVEHTSLIKCFVERIQCFHYLPIYMCVRYIYIYIYIERERERERGRERIQRLHYLPTHIYVCVRVCTHTDTDTDTDKGSE